MWSHLAMPIGPRACSMLTLMPNCPKSRTKAPIGAQDPKSSKVPAQSKTTALSWSWAVETGSAVGSMGFMTVIQGK